MAVHYPPLFQNIEVITLKWCVFHARVRRLGLVYDHTSPSYNGQCDGGGDGNDYCPP